MLVHSCPHRRLEVLRTLKPVRHGGGAFWWFMVVVYGGGVLWWCIVVVYGGGSLRWCMVVVHCGGVW